MRVKVVDASALGALLFGEPKAEEVARALGDAPLAAPALLWFEAASICLKKVNAHENKTEDLLSAFNMMDQLPIQGVEVEHQEVVRLAMELDLTTYDASYLWLALRLNGELVTLDEKMHNAMSSMRSF